MCIIQWSDVTKDTKDSRVLNNNPNPDDDIMQVNDIYTESIWLW